MASPSVVWRLTSFPPPKCDSRHGENSNPFFFSSSFSGDKKKGADYGVCCASAAKLQKPGTCPSPPTDEADETSQVCGVPCANDMQCQGADKCCPSYAADRCGSAQHCLPPMNFSRKLTAPSYLRQWLSAAGRRGFLNGDRGSNLPPTGPRFPGRRLRN